MRTKTAVCLSLVLLATTGCSGGGEAKAELEAKVAELTTKVKALEAENDRLRKQIELLTKTTDHLTEVTEAQKALGTIPVVTPTVTNPPAATPR